KTEEICFPLIICELAKRPLRGLQVLGVLSTDELSAKQAKRVYELYERMSGAASIMPPALAFLFDREGRSDRDREDITKRSRGLVQWLPRRMFENYLLDANAIATTINSLDSLRTEPVTADVVRAWMEDQGSSERFIEREAGIFPNPDWYVNV